MLSSLINKFGKLAGWNSITVNLLGRDVEGITVLEYNDNVETENVYGAGKYPVGYGEGNYAATASITIYIEEANAIQRSLPPGKHFSDIVPFNITVQYEYNDLKITDRIHNCKLPGRGVEVKSGDKVIGYKYNVNPRHISWNVI